MSAPARPRARHRALTPSFATALVPPGAMVERGLAAVVAALDDPVVSPDVELAVRALDAELGTPMQRLGLAAALFELADAFTRATA